jgi:hypothetical protein
VDANEKAPSKFPRSSLRASNKTLIMSSLEIQEMQSSAEVTQLDSPPVEQDASAAASEVLDDAFGDSPALDLDSDAQPNGITAEPALVSGSGVLADELKTRDSSDLLDDIFGDFTEVEATQAASAQEVATSESVAVPTVAAAGRIIHTGPSVPPVSPGAGQPVTTDQAESALKTILDRADDFRGERMESGHVHGHAARTADQKEFVEWRRPSKLIGFLVSFDSDRFGSYVELREGRLVISSEASPTENSLVINDSSVSPMHAIMRIAADGTVLILDQLSEHGTRIKRAGGTEECLMGDKSSLSQGDMVIFGECAYHVCILKIQGA